MRAATVWGRLDESRSLTDVVGKPAASLLRAPGLLEYTLEDALQRVGVDVVGGLVSDRTEFVSFALPVAERESEVALGGGDFARECRAGTDCSGCGASPADEVTGSGLRTAMGQIVILRYRSIARIGLWTTTCSGLRTRQFSCA